MPESNYSFAQLQSIQQGPATLEGVIQGSIIEGLQPAEISFSIYPRAEDAHRSDIDMDSYVRVTLPNPTPAAHNRLAEAQQMGIVLQVEGTYDARNKRAGYFGEIHARSVTVTDQCE